MYNQIELMNTPLKKKTECNYPFLWASLICLAYWTYLFITTQMVVKFDAANYVHLGQTIYKEGWLPYFKTGPNREPLYPLLITFATFFDDKFGIHYMSVMKFIQVGILLSTMYFSYMIMEELSINKNIQFVTLVYMGMSPALVNSAFSLFSEILTYPFIMLSILVLYFIYQSLLHERDTLLIGEGAVLGVLFLGLVFNKGIAEYLLPAVLICFFGLLFLTKRTRNKPIIKKFLICSILTLTLFHIALLPFKFQNKKHNGQFTITNRGPRLLYGSSTKRTGPMNPGKLLAAAASSVGDRVCLEYLNEKDCEYWHFKTSDSIGHVKSTEMQKEDHTIPDINKEMMRLSMKNIFSNPLKYGFLTFLESIRLFFWESTKIGFVTYPERLEQLFSYKPFKNGLRLIVSLMTIFAFLGMINHVWKNVVLKQKLEDESLALLYIMLTFCLMYIGLHALVSMVTRYALPIAPFYLIFIAFFANKIFYKKKPTG